MIVSDLMRKVMADVAAGQVRFMRASSVAVGEPCRVL